LRLQQEFCVKLIGHWRRKDEIIFIDESTTSAW